MKILLGVVIGIIATAVVAALMHDYPKIEIAEKLPEWGQTIGTIVAVLAAIWISHKDRLDAKQDLLSQEITQRKRLVAAIRVEVNAIMSMAEMHKTISENTLEEISRARANGKLLNTDKRPTRTTTFGDRQIYKAVSQWIGILPEAIVAQIVAFYSYIYNVEDLAAASVSVEEMLANTKSHFPRILVGGEILKEQLTMYENVGCGQVANLTISLEMLKKFSEKHGYPLDVALKAFAYK